MTWWWRRGREARADLDEELRLHVDLEADRQRDAGVTEVEARRRARVRLGNRTRIREDVQAVWRWAWLDDLGRDLRLATRRLGRHWRFTALAVSVLAFGIGANTAVFSVANAVLFKPLPVSDPAELVRLFGATYSNVSYAIYEDYRDRAVTLSGLAAFDLSPVSARVDDEPETLQARFVSGNYFEVLGVHAALGRTIRAAEARVTGSDPVAVLGFDYWQRRFSGDPAAVGRSMTINGEPFTIVGVAPQEFRGTMVPFTVDVWLPFHAPGGRPGGPGSVLVVGRRADGISVATARAEIQTLHDGLRREDPERHPFQTMSLYPATGLHPEIAGVVRPFGLALVALAGLVLVVACLNLASLQLARATTRSCEIGVRLALGAGRVRVVRQLLTEAVLLAVVGTGAGVLVAVWGTRTFDRFTVAAPLPVSLVFDATLDWRVFAFAAGLAVLSVLTVGLSPSLRVSHMNPVATITRRGTASTGRRRMRGVLIAGQLGTSVVLLAATGLLLQSWRNLSTVDLGFAPDPVLAVQLDVESQGASPDELRDLYPRLTEGLTGIPGTRAVSVADIVPLTFSNQTLPLLPAGQEQPPTEALPAYRVSLNTVSPGYLDALGMVLLRGRDFTRNDGPDSTPVTMVNQTLADRYWPGQDPLGRRLRPVGAPADLAYEVVGVVADARYVSVGEAPTAFAYRPLAQAPTSSFSLLLQVEDDPARHVPAVRETLARIDPALSILSASPLRSLTGLTVLPVTAAGSLAGGFGLLVLLLAAIGIYGVLSQIVDGRTRELGIRMALGARAGTVVRLVLGQSLRWIAAGLLVGLAGSALVTRLLTGLLYEVSPTDPIALGGATALLLAVGVVAGLGPTRRAVRTSPLTALRTE